MGDAVPFMELRCEVAVIRPEVDAAIARVLDLGWFMPGEELTRFESAFADTLGVVHAVGVGNGSDPVGRAPVEIVGG